ncbi:MAG: carboxypeptidase regulatory-like domain-containing protein [Planctomycetes bacterium]|nr:carboxypeptidase regulatory-like domain-containing protein [Planctomycetota bacterium]
MNPRALGVSILIIGLLAVLFVVFMQGPPQSGAGPDVKNSATPTNRGGGEHGGASMVQSGPTSRPGMRQRVETSKFIPADASDDPVVLFGKVTIPAGVHLEGLEVELRDATGDLLNSGDVDESGKYEVRYGRALLPGWTGSTTWNGVVGPGGKAPAEPGNYAPSFVRFNSLHKYNDAAVECNLVVQAHATIQGKVTIKSSGAPLPGATVVALPSFGPWKDASPEEAETDENGEYKLTLQTLPLQDIYICCKKSDEGDFQSTAVGPTEFRSGETRTLDFQLETAQAFRGRVVEDATGKAVEDAIVTLMPTEYAFSAGFAFDRETIHTEKDGSFEISTTNVPLEKAIIKVEAHGYSPAWRAATAAACAEIRVGKPIVVNGKITDEQGKPVMNVTVTICMRHEWQWSDLSVSDFKRSDGDGKFSMTLTTTPIEDAVIYIDQEPFAPFLAGIKEVLLPSSNETTKDVTIVLHPTPLPPAKIK